MASEDNFLRLDPYNYNSEVEKEIKQGNITVDDLFQLFLDGYVPMETVIEALGYTQD